MMMMIIMVIVIMAILIEAKILFNLNALCHLGLKCSATSPASIVGPEHRLTLKLRYKNKIDK